MENQRITLDDLLKQQLFYLVEFSFGPAPRKFIGEARKVRDIAISSLLISVALNWLLEEVSLNYDGQVILSPHVASDSNNIIFPNRCILLQKDLEIVKRSSEIFSNNWKKICHEVFSNIFDESGQSEVQKQLNSFFEPMWVAVEITPEELNNSFKEKLKQLKDLMFRRKVTRNFAPWQGSMRAKCTNCHEREAITHLAQKYVYCKENEELCAICLLKRLILPKALHQSFENQKIRFDSTRDVCCAYTKRLLKLLPQQCINEIGKITNNSIRDLGFNIPWTNQNPTKNLSHFPCEFLYPERLEELEAEIQLENKQWQKIKTAVTSIQQNLQSYGIKKTTYLLCYHEI